jgi:hypothetical protein
MAAFVAALAIALALSLGLWGSWTASAQTEHVVNQDTGAGDAAPCDAPDFASVSDIETVIDDGSVQNGDTLVLCPGTYTAGAAAGAVEVDKELSIEGLAAADREDVVVQGTAGSHGFTIMADNVTISHLKLVGPGTAGADHGVHLEPAGPTAFNNLELSDLEITNWREGVHVDMSSDANIGPDNEVHANEQGVIILGGALGGQRDRVFNNEIGPNNNVGMALAVVDELYVQENDLAGNGFAQIFVDGESNAFIWNNDIEAGVDLGVYVNSSTADTLVQIGGSPQRTNNFTGTLGPGGFYVKLECGAENTVDATYNYWNGINSNAGISAVVFNDEFDDPATGPDCPGDDKGAVAVHPFVTTAWAPTATPTPSPTATVTGTVTATPTGTPGATRTIDLSPQGWHDLAWSGPDATDPGTALACISGDYSIAYAWEGPTAGFRRYVEGCAIPGICNMSPLDEYDTLLVNITAASASCEMPVAA